MRPMVPLILLAAACAAPEAPAVLSIDPPAGSRIGGEVSLMASVFADGAGEALILVDGSLLHRQDVRDNTDVRAILDTADLNGTVEVTVQVEDEADATAELAVTYTIDQPPLVSWITPATDGTSTDGALDVALSVSDDGSVTDVQILADGTAVGTASAPAWRSSLDLCDYRDAVALEAIATDDGGGSTSASRTVLVERPVRVNLRFDAAVLDASTEIVADIEWDEGLEYVQFLWDGTEIGRVTSITPGGCSDVPCPERCARVRFVWDTNDLPEGDGTLSVVAVDGGGSSRSDEVRTSMNKDFDGDGELAVGYGGTDCDDTDAGTYSAAAEVCDGIDNDCDGDKDEDFDLDGDGFLAGPDCPGAQDCDDTSADARPGGGPEVCGDGLDNDCSGPDDTCRINGLLSSTDLYEYTVVNQSVDLTDFDMDGIGELTIRTGVDVDGERRQRVVWLEPQGGVWPDNWTETQLTRLGQGLEDGASLQVGPEIAFVGDRDADGSGEAYVTVLDDGAYELRWLETTGSEVLSIDDTSPGVTLGSLEIESSAVGEWSDGTAWVAVGSFRDNVAFFELPYTPTPGEAIDQADAHVEMDENTSATVWFGPDVDGDGADDVGISNVLVVDDISGLVTAQDIDHATFIAGDVELIGDMNGDGYGDMIAHNAVHLGQVAKRGLVFAADGWTQITTGGTYRYTAADLDGDGVPDLIQPSTSGTLVFYSDSLGGRLDPTAADIETIRSGRPVIRVPDADGNGAEGMLFQRFDTDDALWMIDGIPYY